MKTFILNCSQIYLTLFGNQSNWAKVIFRRVGRAAHRVRWLRRFGLWSLAQNSNLLISNTWVEGSTPWNYSMRAVNGSELYFQSCRSVLCSQASKLRSFRDQDLAALPKTTAPSSTAATQALPLFEISCVKQVLGEVRCCTKGPLIGAMWPLSLFRELPTTRPNDPLHQYLLRDQTTMIS